MRSLAELSLIKIIGSEKVKEGTRVKFLCGHRALQDYTTKHSMLTVLSGEMTCGWQEVSTIWQKAVAERKELRKTITKLKADTSVYLADELIAEGEVIGDTLVIARVLPDYSGDDLGFMIKRILDQRQAAVLLMGTTDRVDLSFACTESLDIHMGNLLKDACQQLDGRGGGRANFARGSGKSVTKAEDVLNAIKANVMEELSTEG